MTTSHDMPFGTRLLPDGGVEFRLWAPGAAAVQLAHAAAGGAEQLHPMQRGAHGWHTLALPAARPGDDYRFVLPDGLRVPDPASRFNPGDVHGPSRVIDPAAYRWQHAGWRGRPWHEAVVYELHLGTFTEAGSYAAARERLPELAALGITAIELMPLADFPGQRGWGYDGVLMYAPDASYGTPDELKALVDAAHGLGLMVLIDVVYNHFGPEGNYLHAYCPSFFNPAHQTPWGAAINYDGPQARTVRDFYVHNALYWIEEYHFDGLRMDAVHAIRDDSPRHIVREICEALQAGPGRQRQVHVVLENDDNQAHLLVRDASGRPGAATAQWNDDLHHAAHVLATGETDGYYADYADDPAAAFARALAQGYVYQGDPSAFRGGERRGEPSAHLPCVAFVSYLQTHDQIGNRAFGERIHQLADPVLLEAAYACLLLSPHIPMLFMGEEFAASTPFLYFCDFGPELAEAVSRGRREEFGRFAAFSDEAARERIPDPNAPGTLQASRLRWDERQQGEGARVLARMQALLQLRQRELVPRLAGMREGGRWRCQDGCIEVAWDLGGAKLRLLANFGEEPVRGMAAPAGRVLHQQRVNLADGGLELARGGVCVALEA
ncbi:malto-oligosyltrehalose trehalohydrolase [Ramlibacter sp. AW1]|uniref:Malto-oligosyltrehalose trehalohydrolase n=1 Tax=Ramlibacter aurantiacus TaxID=2801330 RepID=A0A936ZNP7_9BURK|nr:malto-oligosyltrehalose trehalohydrolase [Ramlibacter aurantiacus]MBL0420991.1 malto-oligosyltrehalose trehalohydrolase [Ramlibacter aurantiacus]